MSLIFYPFEDDIHQTNSIEEKLQILLESAERYKAATMDVAKVAESPEAATEKKRMVPSELTAAYNWDAIAKTLREIREMTEATPAAKVSKANNLTKLAEVYEVLRAAKMQKLEAVRLALINEANQIRGSAAQVA